MQKFDSQGIGLPYRFWFDSGFETERFDKRIGLTGWYKQIVKSQEIECSSVQSTLTTYSMPSFVV